MTRCTEFAQAVRHLRTGRRHLVRAASRFRVWTYCGDVVFPTSYGLVGWIPVDEAECSTCREAYLLDKRHRPPGWWATRREVPTQTRRAR